MAVIGKLEAAERLIMSTIVMTDPERDVLASAITPSWD
jgi:hypothetical protein